MNEERCIPPQDYKEMVEEIGIDKFRQRLKGLQEMAEKFIEDAGYSTIVQCNERILLQVLLDYYVDIFRLKDFHGIEKVRTGKIFAYTIAWLIRRKPLQYTCYTEDEKDIFVNERFAVYLLVNECLLSGEKRFVKEVFEEQLKDYTDMLLYYFKYRQCNPQTLELLIESFKMGSLVISDDM